MIDATFKGESKETKRLREREEILAAMQDAPVDAKTKAIACSLVTGWLDGKNEREDREERTEKSLARIALALEGCARALNGRVRVDVVDGDLL